MGKNILQYLFSGYLKLLKKTVAIEWQEIQFVTGNQVFGFWHEDSFLMNLVLEELSGKTSPVDVIVTADTRGDYIEHMLQACGGHALRVPDGFAAFGALKKILQDSYEQTRRWDHYAIPLPFSKISVAVHDYGEVNKKQIPDLPTRAETSECGILLKDA